MDIDNYRRLRRRQEDVKAGSQREVTADSSQLASRHTKRAPVWQFLLPWSRLSSQGMMVGGGRKAAGSELSGAASGETAVKTRGEDSAVLK